MINEKSLIFVSWNVNGLKKCVEKGFEDFFLWIEADFFCIQITKMNEVEKTFSFDGFYEFWNDSEKDRYSGTLIYTKHSPLNVYYGLSDGLYNDEGRIITLEYPDFYLVNSYVPSAKKNLERLPHKLDYEDKVRDYFKKICNDKPIIVCGDLNVIHKGIDSKLINVPTNKAGYTKEEIKKFEELLDIGLVDSFRYRNPKRIKYSAWSYIDEMNNTMNKYRSDYFLVSNTITNNIISADIFEDLRGSNHKPIILEMRYPIVVKQQYK